MSATLTIPLPDGRGAGRLAEAAARAERDKGRVMATQDGSTG